MAEVSNVVASSEQSVAQPKYLLRGHAAQIHALHFLRGNLRLLSGDADGWVVLWSLPTKRAVAVWRAHTNTILGLGSWDDNKIITHGRDNKLYVWKLSTDDEEQVAYSTLLPVSDSIQDRPRPWLLHSLDVNALNFCAFAQCQVPSHGDEVQPGDGGLQPGGILIATPGVQDGYVNITALPNEDRMATIPKPKDTNTGMVMAIALHFLKNDNVPTSGTRSLIMITGYESGHACIWQQPQGRQVAGTGTQMWQVIYIHNPHAQPVLSLSVAASLGCFFTSSADAIVARHPLPATGVAAKSVQTRHAGQQSLKVRDDERIFATAGWDGCARVYSAKTMKELAVLKWHREGCYAVAFAGVTGSARSEAAGGESRVDGDGDDEVRGRELTVSQQRIETARTKHWLAAGSKDGKVSLWDIY